MKYTFVLFFLAIILSTPVFGQFKSNYPSIPRIDVHSHVAGDLNRIANYLQLGDVLTMKLPFLKWKELALLAPLYT